MSTTNNCICRLIARICRQERGGGGKLSCSPLRHHTCEYTCCHNNTVQTPNFKRVTKSVKHLTNYAISSSLARTSCETLTTIVNIIMFYWLFRRLVGSGCTVRCLAIMGLPRGGRLTHCRPTSSTCHSEPSGLVILDGMNITHTVSLRHTHVPISSTFLGLVKMLS